MPVIYDGKKLIPAPIFSCVKEYQTADDGRIIGKSYQIQVKGKFVAFMGSPNSNGDFWTGSGYPPNETPVESKSLASHLKKQDAIRRLFAQQGRVFEVQAIDGSLSLRCNPRILRIETPESYLTTVSDYTVVMECPTLFINEVEDEPEIEQSNIEKASEEWSMEILNEDIMSYRLSHTLSAVGKVVYDESGIMQKQPWEHAKDYVLNHLGLGLDNSKMVSEGVIDGDDLQAYNYLRGQNTNELTGSFSVNESWVCYAGGAAVEEFTVTTRTSVEGRTSVTVAGTVTGFAKYNNATRSLISSKYHNANQKWQDIRNSILTRAQTQSGITLNPTELSKEVSTNETSGVIGYSYEFDNRPAPLLAGAKSTAISMTDDNPADVFASIPIPGRIAGPILQPMSTVTPKKRVVALTAQMPLATYGNTISKPNSASVFTQYIPQYNSQIFVESDQESFVDATGQYSRTITFVYE